MPPPKRARKSSPITNHSSFIPASHVRDAITPPPKDVVDRNDGTTSVVATATSVTVSPAKHIPSSNNDKNKNNTTTSPTTPLLNKSSRTTQSSPYTPTPGSGAGYNAMKSFNGQVYTGMAVGGSHIWNYDQGVWKETKEEPDLWKIDFETKKRRAKNAPEGSGAPVGMEYHWLVVAHQYVRKTDANTYETHLVGSKYKLAHKSGDATSWSIPTVKAQREREVELLDDAKRRVLGLPPVLAAERVKVEKKEKGQRKLDSLFKMEAGVGKKRKVGDLEDGNGYGDDKENLELR